MLLQKQNQASAQSSLGVAFVPPRTFQKTTIPKEALPLVE